MYKDRKLGVFREDRNLPVSSRDGYLIPVQIDIVKISQGYNGPWSHFSFIRKFRWGENYHDDRFSVDFDVPYGTPVIAAKTGVAEHVADFSDRFYDGSDIEEGLRAFPNFVTLKHNDGTYTLYSHLGKNSTKVRKGDLVKQGEVIAKTGQSGWIGNLPHLHFEPLILTKGYERRSFPVLFENFEGKLEHQDLT